MKYYIDVDNNYIGGWDKNPPQGSVEVPHPPSRADQKWNGSDWDTPPVTKQDRRSMISTLTVTTMSGKVFDADKDARDALTTAITAGQPGESTPWKLADNSVVSVTWEELLEALRLVGVEHTRLIAV